MTSTSWLEHWKTPDYIEKKKYAFNITDEYLKTIPDYEPRFILDIGCGLAFESEMFQKKYESLLYLLDDDFDNNTEDQKRSIFFGSPNTFKFYSNINDLFESYKERELQYNFVYARNPKIDDTVKFDLIYSNRSCGFHYPADSYNELIKKHSYEKTVIILDIWKEVFDKQMENFNLINIIEDGEQHYKVHITF